MMLLDVNGCIVDANPAMHTLLGFEGDDLRGVWGTSLLHPEDADEVRSSLARLMAGELESVRQDHRFLRPDGEVVWASSSMSLVRGSDGRPSFAIVMVQDVTLRREAEEQLVRQSQLNQHQALHDALTGLPNRTLFRERVEQALRASTRSGSRVAVLMMDLDRFKEVNDSLGHAAGDALLVELSRRLRTVLREADTVARLGGDEFGLILPDPTAPHDVLTVIARLREAIEEPVLVQGLPLAVEASIGVALSPDHGDDYDALLQRADVAMYRAKEEHGGHAFYDGRGADQDPVRLTLVAELRRALEERELELHFQPKALLADGTVHAVEALLRWRHPERGMVAPDDFIPLAQRTGLMKPLTLYVVDEALHHCRAWAEHGVRLSVAVNLSARNLVDAEFPRQVADLLERWEVEPSVLEFELTESTMLSDPVRTKAVLEQLSTMGIRLSIDDFGTGYSSLAYLKSLPVSEIKIDRSFVMNMHEDEDDAMIVRSTIDLGRNLGLDVVAEGVETQAHWDRLRDLGCTLAQGYFLAPALPAEALVDWVLERRSPSAAAA